MFLKERILFYFGLLFSFLVILPPAYGDNELEKLIRDGIQSGISIQAQKITLEQANLAKTNSWANLLPTLSLSAGETSSTSDSMTNSVISSSTTDSRTAEVSGSWTLWDNYSNIRNIQMAGMTANSESLKTERELETYILTLIDSYFEYLLNLRRREVLTQQLEQAKWTHQESLTLVKAGARTEIELLDTEIQVLNSERDLMELNQIIKSNIRGLQVLLNKDENYDIPKMNIVDLKPYYMKLFPQALEKLKAKSAQQILESSKEYQISKLGIDLNLEKLRQTELGYWPSLSLRVSHTLNLNRYVEQVPTGGARAGLNSTSVSLNLSWQFWDWGTTPRSILSSQLDYKSAFLRFSEEVKTNKSKIESYLEEYDITAKSVEASEKALNKANKQLDYAREMYRLGRLNLLMMQQATSRLFDAQTAFSSRKKALYILAARLMYFQNQSLVPKD